MLISETFTRDEALDTTEISIKLFNFQKSGFSRKVRNEALKSYTKLVS